MKDSRKISFIILCVVVFVTCIVGGIRGSSEIKSSTLKILSSTENKDLESIVRKYAQRHKITLAIDYAGTLEIMDIMNGKNTYDAIWTSNSIWLYMLENQKQISNSESTSINPVLFGIKKSKAEELGFVNKEVTMNDLLSAIKEKKLKFVMSSATQTNTGASAYLGFLATLAGNKEVLTLEDLESESLRTDVANLLQGVERSSGSDEFLNDLVIENDYDAIVSYESSIISLNQELEKKGEMPFYLIYPVDGVSLSDSPFAYVDQGDSHKKEMFLLLQKDILSDEGQVDLANTGRRTWYGGTKSDTDPKVFNKDWGIDTEKYLSPVKYPNTEVIKSALAMYQEELRKPAHIVFALDYSGSMYGEGYDELMNAMDYILDYEKAKVDMVQFSKKDKITVLPFNQKVITTFQTENGLETDFLMDKLETITPMGQTNLYDTILEGVRILENESSDYNTSIVLMTDGEGNTGSYSQFAQKYEGASFDIPVYGILFGNANESQLSKIASVTKGKVFDGKKNLKLAFKEVRGYN